MAFEYSPRITSILDSLEMLNQAEKARLLALMENHDHQLEDYLSILVTASDVEERARDALGTALTAGTGITITPNDGADTITVASSITQYTDEMARDALGAALTAGAGITITPNDGSDIITIAALGITVTRSRVGTTETTTSGTFTALATAHTVTGTIPASGKAILIHSAVLSNDTTNGETFYAFESSDGAYTAVNATSVGATFPNPGRAYNQTFVGSLTGLTPGSVTFTAKGRVAVAGTASISERVMTLITW